MDTTNTLDIKEFISVCQQLVLQAGLFIKEAYESNAIVVQRKSTGEAYTDYDLKIQTFYLKVFKRLWPNMKIIGEETQDFTGPIEYDYEGVKTDLLPSHIFEGLSQTKIDLNKAILWIDPIDGTSQFVKRKMENVTTLLGISVDGRATLGIIGRFYAKKGEDVYEWDPRCYFGYAEYPHIYVIDYLKDNKVEEFIRKEREEKERLTCSIMYFDNPQRTALVEKFADLHRIGGAEGLAVIEGYSDIYVYRGLGYQKWDLCAGEAILRCIGGTATDPFGKEFVYEEEQQTWECPNGQLICSSKKILEKVLPLLNPKDN